MSSDIYYDPDTNLEWMTGPDNDTSWDEAKEWVEGLGNEWRMPTMDELRSLYKEGVGTRNMTPLLKTTGWYVWSDETEGSSSAWIFTFVSGDEYGGNRGLSLNSRGFAVRNRGKRNMNNSTELKKLSNTVDKIMNVIEQDKLTFEEAAVVIKAAHLAITETLSNKEIKEWI